MTGCLLFRSSWTSSQVHADPPGMPFHLAHAPPSMRTQNESSPPEGVLVRPQTLKSPEASTSNGYVARDPAPDGGPPVDLLPGWTVM